MVILTKAQRIAVHRIWCRGADDNPPTYREFRRRVVGGFGYVMIPWCGMWLGIEPDGYTHS